MSSQELVKGLLILALAAGLAPEAQAEEARLVVRVSGKVDSRQAQDAKWRPIFASRLLGLDDWTRTGADSKARVHLEGGRVVTLGPITQIRLAQVGTSDQGPLTRLRQGIGQINAVVREGSPLEVRTPSATLAVRGTEFDCLVVAVAPLPEPAVLQSLQAPFQALTQAVPGGVASDGPVDWRTVLSNSLQAASGQGAAQHQQALVDLASALQASEHLSPEVTLLINQVMKLAGVTYDTQLGVKKGAVEYQALDEEGNLMGHAYLCEAGQQVTVHLGQPAARPVPAPQLLPSRPVMVRSTSTDGNPRDPDPGGSNFADLGSYLPFLPTTATLRVKSGSSVSSIEGSFLGGSVSIPRWWTPAAPLLLYHPFLVWILGAIGRQVGLTRVGV